MSSTTLMIFSLDYWSPFLRFETQTMLSIGRYRFNSFGVVVDGIAGESTSEHPGQPQFIGNRTRKTFYLDLKF